MASEITRVSYAILRRQPENSNDAGTDKSMIWINNCAQWAVKWELTYLVWQSGNLFPVEFWTTKFSSLIIVKTCCGFILKSLVKFSLLVLYIIIHQKDYQSVLLHLHQLTEENYLSCDYRRVVIVSLKLFGMMYILHILTENLFWLKITCNHVRLLTFMSVSLRRTW